ncbi:MAG: DUF1501 domain-containing protein [Armatimonadetes bacterium]|nr:DUF1501 domain-containing protein [Armatimonadota bacterium]
MTRRAPRPSRLGHALSRRDFLHAGSLSLLGLSASPLLAARPASAAPQSPDVSLILLFLVGGPSQIDTWDPKPDAPAEVRGPFRAIPTNVDGIRVTEIFPRMARQAHRFSLVRSVHHTAPAIHDTGYQLMQTGRLFSGGSEHPHVGAVLAHLRGSKNGLPPWVVLPTSIGATGGNLPHGQSAGHLSKTCSPFLLAADPSHREFSASGRLPPDASAAVRRAFAIAREPEALRQRYGMNKFGQSCLLARRLIEHGVRCVSVNMCETVFNEMTWDMHGSPPFTPLIALKESLGPRFDTGFSTLLEDLHQRGMLDTTLVVATGEFGRTPRINPAGGRDHWPQCWTVLLAGGGVQGGRVVGVSDALGAYPKDRPVTPAEVVATIYHALGLNLDQELCGPRGRPLPLVDYGVQPITELF